MYLGIDMETGRPIAYNGDGHLLTIGPTRSGKSRRLLIPNLLHQTGQSMVVIDTKGELAYFTAEHRATRGEVVALDPYGILAKRGLDIPVAGFNPLRSLNPNDENFVDDATALAEALIQVPRSGEAFWAEAAQDLLAALIMLARVLYGEKASLRHVRTSLAKTPTDMAALAELVLRTRPHEAIVTKLANYREIKDNRNVPGILATAQAQTRFLDSPSISNNLALEGRGESEEGSKLLSLPSIDFGSLKETTATVYLILPPERLLTHAKWLRLLISSAMTAMQRNPKVPDPHVLFMLDEFPQLGRLTSIEAAVSLNAGFGVKVWAAVQHLGQLKDQYGDNWETFLSAGCVTAFAPRDVFTRDHLTKMIGQGPRPGGRSKTYNQSGASVTESTQKDDLVAPHEWRAMKMGEQFAFIPTPEGQLIRRTMGVDFTELPEVLSGQLRPRRF